MAESKVDFKGRWIVCPQDSESMNTIKESIVSDRFTPSYRVSVMFDRDGNTMFVWHNSTIRYTYVDYQEYTSYQDS